MIAEANNEQSFSSLNKKLKYAEYIAAVCISIAIFSVAAAYYFYTKHKKAEDMLGAIEMEKSVMSEVSNTRFINSQKQSEDYSSFISCILNNSTNNIELMSDQSASTIKVWWNKDSKELFLASQNLPAAQKGTSYHLWVMADNKTIDAGEINTMQDIQKMNNIEDAEEFFISDENKSKTIARGK